MKTKLIGLPAIAISLWTGAASAEDAFTDCASASAHGWNQARFFISAIYNKADCARPKATQYERTIFDIIPTYWAAETRTTMLDSCLLAGNFMGWMDTIQESYAECSERLAPNFDFISRATIGRIAGSLFAAFYWTELSRLDTFSDQAIVESFSYDYSTWSLTGSRAECEAEIATQTVGIPAARVGTLVETVCR